MYALTLYCKEEAVSELRLDSDAGVSASHLVDL